VTIEEEDAMNEAQHRVPFSRDPEPHTGFDATDVALADLLDMADEALLAFADSQLSKHPLWVALRKMAGDAHNNLCDYRVMRSMEAK
jgi:hypothetical protein